MLRFIKATKGFNIHTYSFILHVHKLSTQYQKTYFMVKSTCFDVTFSIFIENSFLCVRSIHSLSLVLFSISLCFDVLLLFPFRVLMFPFHFHANVILLSVSFSVSSATKTFPSFPYCVQCKRASTKRQNTQYTLIHWLYANRQVCADRVRCIPLQIVTKYKKK